MFALSTLDDAQKLLSTLDRAELAQLLQRVACDLGESPPGIESNPDVCGGEACIVRTRIPVWLLEQDRRLGTSEVELPQSYPTLRAEDLANAGNGSEQLKGRGIMNLGGCHQLPLQISQ